MLEKLLKSSNIEDISLAIYLMYKEDPSSIGKLNHALINLPNGTCGVIDFDEWSIWMTSRVIMILDISLIKYQRFTVGGNYLHVDHRTKKEVYVGENRQAITK